MKRGAVILFFSLLMLLIFAGIFFFVFVGTQGETGEHIWKYVVYVSVNWQQKHIVIWWQ